MLARHRWDIAWEQAHWFDLFAGWDKTLTRAGPAKCLILRTSFTRPVTRNLGGEGGARGEIRAGGGQHHRSASKTNWSANCHRLESITGQEQIVEDRALWKAKIKVAAGQFEEERKLASDTKCQERKQAASQPQWPDEVFIYSRCTRTCRSRIGQHSHRRACDRNNRTTSQWTSRYEEIAIIFYSSLQFPLLSSVRAEFWKIPHTLQFESKDLKYTPTKPNNVNPKWQPKSIHDKATQFSAG